MNVAKKIQECFLICWKTLQKWNLNIRTYTCHAFQILQEITTYSPADTSLAFSSTFLPLVGRPGFIFRGLVGVFPLPVPPPPVCMKWANSSVCLSKNSNLLPLSASYKHTKKDHVKLFEKTKMHLFKFQVSLSFLFLIYQNCFLL